MEEAARRGLVAIPLGLSHLLHAPSGCSGGTQLALSRAGTAGSWGFCQILCTYPRVLHQAVRPDYLQGPISEAVGPPLGFPGSAKGK